MSLCWNLTVLVLTTSESLDFCWKRKTIIICNAGGTLSDSIHSLANVPRAQRCASSQQLLCLAFSSSVWMITTRFCKHTFVNYISKTTALNDTVSLVASPTCYRFGEKFSARNRPLTTLINIWYVSSKCSLYEAWDNEPIINWECTVEFDNAPSWA